MHDDASGRVAAARTHLARLASQQGWLWVDHDRFVSYGPRQPGWAHVGTVTDELLGVKLVAGSGWIGATDVEREVVRRAVASVETNDVHQLVLQDEWPLIAFAAGGTVLFRRLEHLDDVLPSLAAMLHDSMRQTCAVIIDGLVDALERVDEPWRPFVASVVRLAKHPDMTFIARADAESATFVHDPTDRTVTLERADDGSLIVLTFVVGSVGRALDVTEKAVARGMAKLADAMPEVQLFEADPPLGPGLAFASILEASATPDAVVAALERHDSWTRMSSALTELDPSP